MKDAWQQEARRIPRVDRLLADPAGAPLVAAFGRPRAADAVRRALAALRARLRAGASPPSEEFTPAAVWRAARADLEAAARPRLRRVLNATGILLHTGLGRARMPDAARHALDDCYGYCNLQIDLAGGERGRREEAVLETVRELTGAEDALVVNNNAAATLLMLRALAAGREVIVSRGELIEIGGSFRLPDIMRESGALLREVGTTNKTHRRDYEQALSPQTGMLLKVHPSNYRMVGFTAAVPVAELAELGRRHGVPVVDDLGGGALVDLATFGLPSEPTVAASLRAGADLALCSTDKLIGGPQGGLLAGRAAVIGALRSHPLYRAMRVGKLTLAALEATLKLFRRPEELARAHPLYRMLARTPAELKRQALRVRAALRKDRPDWQVGVAAAEAFLGGGALPGRPLPTWVVTLRDPARPPAELARALRGGALPVIPRVQHDAVCLDMRSVGPEEVRALRDALRQLA